MHCNRNDGDITSDGVTTGYRFIYTVEDLHGSSMSMTADV